MQLIGGIAEILYLDNNDIGGTIPTTVSRMKHLGKWHEGILQKFILDKPDRACTMFTSLFVLFMFHFGLNQIAWFSFVFDSHYCISNKDEVHLYKNMLTGSLPTELGVLNNIAHIYLDNNQLTGSIPSEWGGLEDLKHFYLHENSLIGFLPTEFGNLKDLENFRAYNNQLSGNLPSEMGQLFKLGE
eukprot:6549170-Ditylum_brightwellii.AAC.1